MTRHAHLLVGPASEDLEHTLFLRWSLGPPLPSDVEKLVKLIGGEENQATEHGAPLRMQLQDKFGYGPEVGPRATDAPQ